MGYNSLKVLGKLEEVKMADRGPWKIPFLGLNGEKGLLEVVVKGRTCHFQTLDSSALKYPLAAILAVAYQLNIRPESFNWVGNDDQKSMRFVVHKDADGFPFIAQEESLSLQD